MKCLDENESPQDPIGDSEVLSLCSWSFSYAVCFTLKFGQMPVRKVEIGHLSSFDSISDLINLDR